MQQHKLWVSLLALCMSTAKMYQFATILKDHKHV